MRALSWLIFLAAIAVAIYAIRMIWQRMERQRKASEERAASLLAQVVPRQAQPPILAPAPVRQPDPQERPLLEAAAKAAEAGEPALAIQLYGRLLARYPETSFALQARSAVEVLKKKI